MGPYPFTATSLLSMVFRPYNQHTIAGELAGRCVRCNSVSGSLLTDTSSEPGHFPEEFGFIPGCELDPRVVPRSLPSPNIRFWKFGAAGQVYMTRNRGQALPSSKHINLDPRNSVASFSFPFKTQREPQQSQAHGPCQLFPYRAIRACPLGEASAHPMSLGRTETGDFHRRVDMCHRPGGSASSFRSEATMSMSNCTCSGYLLANSAMDLT